jgi:hypothetical protein
MYFITMNHYASSALNCTVPLVFLQTKLFEFSHGTVSHVYVAAMTTQLLLLLGCPGDHLLYLSDQPLVQRKAFRVEF